MSETDVELSVHGPAQVTLNGTLYPAEPCQPGEFEYWVEIPGQETTVITFDDCESQVINQTFILNPQYGTVSVTLKLRYVDRANNTWMFTEQQRYSVDLTNPLQPQITELTGTGEKG